MTEPAHLVPIILNDRGFRNMPPVPHTYDGEVSVYESSAASGPHIWLGVTHDYGDGRKEAVAHLTAEQAIKVAEQLLWLAEHHYQGATARLAKPEGTEIEPGFLFVPAGVREEIMHDTEASDEEVDAYFSALGLSDTDEAVRETTAFLTAFPEGHTDPPDAPT